MKMKTSSRKPKKSMVAPEPKFGLAELKSINGKAITSAGSRYFPNCNLQIEPLDEAIAGLVGGDEFRACVEDFAREIREKWGDASRRMNSGMLSEPKRILRALDTLATSIPGGGGEEIVKCRQAIDRAHKRIGKLYEELDSENSTERETQRNLTRYDYALSEARRFLSGTSSNDYGVYDLPNACGLHKNGSLLMSGEWGVGKTHSLCALAAKQMERALPVLLVLAESFDPGEFPGDALARRTELAENLDELLRGLDALGCEAGVRALLLIDSVNESPKDGWDAWRKGLGEVLKQVRRFPHVGLIVSCRDPFSYEFPAAVQKQMSHWEHRGFEDLDKAQQAYLEHYGISPSDIPLIGEDVTRPLALRIICEEISKLPQSKREARYDEIVSGQVGINAVFERYIQRRAGVVGRKHAGLSAENKVWNLVKKDLAGYLAENLTNEMPESRFLKAVRERCAVDAGQAKKILGYMADEGVINRRRVFVGTGGWVAGKRPPTRAVIRMPFQWFGDHIVVRALLRNLNTASAETVRESFAADKPLGKIFLPDEFHEDFPVRTLTTIAGWREALILEFPERVAGLVKKCQIPNKQRELLFNLPDPERMRESLNDPFMSGLHMRANEHITTTTVQMVDECLRGWESMASQRSDIRYMGRGMAESVLSLSRRRHSRLSARHYLYSRHVKPMKMSDRDILWGSVTQQARRTKWTNSLFAWLDGLERRGFPVPVTVARNYIVLLSLFLGTTDRPLRNRATRALVAIGERFPAALFFHTLDTLDFDDIYYPERMLAASYGVAMSLWNNPKAIAFRSFRAKFPAFANAVVKDVFTPGGRLLTHHVAVRDYALGIASIARKLGVKFPKSTEKYMALPFLSVSCPFPMPSEISKDELVEAQSHSLRSDFANYTLGGLIPCRRAHDYKHRGYAVLMHQIQRRMQAFGYSEPKFRMADRWINENQWGNSDKVDRYAKKYMWIAYYEMVGWMHATGKLSETHIDGPRSLPGLLDPSFPTAPPEWNPYFESLPASGNGLHWIVNGPAPDYAHIRKVDTLGKSRGPWVLLEGLVERKSEDSGNFLSSHLRGFFVRASRIPFLRSHLLLESDYPSIPRVMDFAMTDDVFAGEIPWSPKFIGDHSRNGVWNIFSHFPNSEARATALFFFWEEQYDGGSQEFFMPTPDICARLKLSRRGRMLDLVDETGKRASSYHTHAAAYGPAPRTKKSEDKYRFLHLRKDLLDKYLSATDTRLIWIVWGDRLLLEGRLKPKTAPDPLEESAYQAHRHIYKRLIEYAPTDE